MSPLNNLRCVVRVWVWVRPAWGWAPGGGSTIGAGGLSFRVRYGSGRFPARCGRRDGGGVVVRGPWWPAPRVWGWGGLVLGCVVDAGGLVRRPPRRSRAGGCAWVWVCVVRVGLLVPVG